MTATRLIPLILSFIAALILAFGSNQQHPFLTALFIIFSFAAFIISFHFFVKISITVMKIINPNFLNESGSIIYGYMIGVIAAIFSIIVCIYLTDVLINFLQSLN
jgi:hypothetical protein